MSLTLQHIAATGGTYYAFPASQSLAAWTTYRVQLVEGTVANIGRYQGTVDSYGPWYVFSGASQPASWDDYVAVSGGDASSAQVAGTTGSAITLTITESPEINVTVE